MNNGFAKRLGGCGTNAATRLALGLEVALLLAACGGGGGGTSPPPTQNPVPTLTSISPTDANAGGPAFTLTVTGSSFISSSRVRWGGSNRTTTLVSSTQLTAAISASDIAAGASINVTVFNPTPGGGTSGAQVFTITNPAPTLATISPTSATAGGPAFTLTVNGTNFVSNSVVQWNGSGRTTTFVSATQVTAAIAASDIASVGSASVSVVNPAPGGGTSAAAATFTINAPSPLSILTSGLPDTTGGRDYNFTLAATGGIPPYSWSISAGALPGGLTIDPATGQISGTVVGAGTDTAANFTVFVTDSASTPNTGNRALSITVRAAGNLGSNNACSSGTTSGTTQISNGRLRASISPYGDVDVYSFHGTAGNQVTIEIFAARLDLDGDLTNRDSYLDSIVELLADTCPDPTLDGTSALAWSDDIDPGVVQDSLIQNFTLPYTGTYFIRVRDFRGDGRPDLIYDLTLSGAD